MVSFLASFTPIVVALLVVWVTAFLAEDYRRFRDGTSLAAALAGELQTVFATRSQFAGDTQMERNLLRERLTCAMDKGQSGVGRQRLNQESWVIGIEPLPRADRESSSPDPRRFSR